jgi:two-component system phosphate regulon sensor histidine kinase PhoR
MILRSPIFRKLLWSAFLLILATMVALDFYLTPYAVRQQVEHVEQRLEAEARILYGELASVPVDELQRWSEEAGSRARARVTLVDPEGVVLADSQRDPESVENHAHRPEIQEAIRAGVGASRRHSVTLNKDLCYLALRVDYRGQARSVLCLAVPLADLDSAMGAIRWRFLEASLVAALVALGIAYLFSRSFTGRIDDLRVFAEGLVEARFSGTRHPVKDDELGAVARSLNRMSAQLRELVDRLTWESAQRAAILASMVEGVLAVDGDMRVTFCNDSFARAVDAHIPVLEFQPVLELARDPGLIDMLKQVLFTGKSVKQRLQLSAGEARVFEVQAAPLAAPSRPGAIAILHDITDLERLERVRKDFVANVSHELRTPLTAIRGYAETLLEGALEDKENNRRFLEVIKAHAIRLNNIASDLLVLAELELGKPGSELDLVSVREAIDSALGTVESAARLRSVRVRRGQIDDGTLRGDKVRLEQALVNLLDNAVKFNRPGGEVTVQAGRADDERTQITVSDTGIGIPSQDLPRIFERFYRVDKARSRDVGGTGLGLSIVKHVVERMNGVITVESQLGKGSTFTILFPSQ